MALPGRKPNPTRLKLIEGNPGKRPLAKNEPKPRPVAPACPRWLATEAKREWQRVVPELERMGLLTIVDRAALATYCQAWARYREAEEALERYGPILKAKESEYIQVSPYATISRHNAQLVKALCAEFGLTPSSRGRMSLPSDDDDDPEGILD